MNSNLNTINHSNISYYLAYVDCTNENGTNCTEAAAAQDMSGHFHPTMISEYTLRYGLWASVFLCISYGLIFIIGTLGNISVIYVIYKSPKMRNTTFLFIGNLAVADLLVNILCLPFTLIGNLFPAYFLGIFLCKAVSYLQGVSVSASINTLMAISIERCTAIAFPLQGAMTHSTYKKAVSTIWLVALTINLPWIFVFHMEPLEPSGMHGKSHVCIELWPTHAYEKWYFIVANLVVGYVGPLLVISVCYLCIWHKVAHRKLPNGMVVSVRNKQVIHRNKFKVVKMVLVVIITFAVSWLPLYSIFCYVKLASHTVFDASMYSVLIVILPVAQWLGASNSCINPILYAFMNQSFRTGFKNLFNNCCVPSRDPLKDRGSMKCERAASQGMVSMKNSSNESKENGIPVIAVKSNSTSESVA